MERSRAALAAVLLISLVAGASFLGAGRLGLAQDATPEAIINPVDVAHPAHVHVGNCAGLGEVVAPLSDLTRSQGEPVGAPGAIVATRSFTTVPLTLGALMAEPHALNVHLSAEDIDTYLACGEIGGVVDVNGALTIGLRDMGRGHHGVAYLAPGAEAGTTGILIFMTETDATGAGVGAGATPVAEGAAEGLTPEPTAVSTEETVEVSLTEWAINMPTELEAGTVIFEVINDGTVPHTLEIANETFYATLDAPLGPGETARLTVDLTPGVYTVICPLGDGAHRDIGMLLEVTVN